MRENIRIIVYWWDEFSWGGEFDNEEDVLLSCVWLGEREWDFLNICRVWFYLGV